MQLLYQDDCEMVLDCNFWVNVNTLYGPVGVTECTYIIIYYYDAKLIIDYLNIMRLSVVSYIECMVSTLVLVTLHLHCQNMYLVVCPVKLIDEYSVKSFPCLEMWSCT